MKLSVRVDTSEFRGDHASDVCRVYELRDGETVEQLAARALKKRDQYHDPHHDVIRIQLVDDSP